MPQFPRRVADQSDVSEVQCGELKHSDFIEVHLPHGVCQLQIHHIEELAARVGARQRRGGDRARRDRDLGRGRVRDDRGRVAVDR